MAAKGGRELINLVERNLLVEGMEEERVGRG